MADSFESLIWRTALKADRKILLLALAHHADGDGVSFPGVPLLARETGLTTRGVEKMLALFVQCGFLKIIERGNGRGHTNKYRILTSGFNQANPEPYSGFNKDNPERHSVNTVNPEQQTPNTVQGLTDKTVEKPRTDDDAYKEQLLKELNNLSEANASGADAPNVAQRIWGEGVKLLKAAGESDKNARSFLGRMAKKHSRESVAAAIASAGVSNAADPKTYLVKVLENQKSGSKGNDYGEERNRRARRDLATLKTDWRAKYRECNARRGKVGPGVPDGGTESGDGPGPSPSLYAPP